MTESIIIALISGGLALLGTMISVSAGFSKSRQEQEVNNAIQNEKIDVLTKEVRKHNDFASRIPVLETKVENLEREVNK